MAKRSREDIALRYPQGSVLAPANYPIGDGAEDYGLLEGTLNHHVKECETAKWPHALRWFTNFSFLLGNQYGGFVWNSTSNNLSLVNASDTVPLTGGIEASIPRSVDNKLIRPHENLISMFTEIRPRPRVSPQSESPEDTDAAALAEIVVDLKWEELGMPRHMRATASMLSVTGTAIAETFYGQRGIPVAIEDDEPQTEMVEDVTGEEVEVEREARPEEEGEYRSDCQNILLSPFHFSSDPGATEDPKSLVWYYYHYFADRGWVAENYCDKSREDGYLLEGGIEEIPETSGTDFALYWWERIKDLVETPEGFAQLSSRVGNATGGFAPNQTLLRVWGVAPSSAYPKGRTFVQAGEKLIYAKDEAPGYHEDFPERWHRLSICRFWTIPGRFWGMPLLSELLPLQKKINAIDSLVQINREYMTLGQWLIPEQCKVQDGALGGLPGVPISYMANAAGAKPEKVRHESLPGELIAERELAERSIERLSATESMLSADAPSSMRSAAQMDINQRMLRQSKSPTLQDFGEYCESITTNLLIETQIHMQTQDDAFSQRVVAAARDRESHLAIATFVGADIRGNVNVSIDIATELMKTPEAKQERAAQALQYVGKDLSPADRIKALTLMGLDEFAAQDSSDYKHAKRMVALITNGQAEAVGPNPFQIDNPTIHMQVFKQELQSDRMVQYDDQTRNALMMIYLHYREEAMNEAMEQLKIQMLMEQGAQPQQGGAPAKKESKQPYKAAA
jgi:hypothetical protein